jgi:hypothetical protein
MREGGLWNTLFLLASNDSLEATLAGLPGDNSATLLRLLEIKAPRRMRPPDTAGQTLINGLDQNYGHAGREFLKYITTHTDKIEAAVKGYKDRLNRLTQALDTTERFYVAGGAAILTGAAVARKLELIRNLDIAAMQQVVIDAIVKARKEHEVHAPTDPRQRAINALERFCGANQKRHIVTACFPTHGVAVKQYNSKAGFVLFRPDRLDDELAFQISVDDATLRINHHVWDAWARREGLSPEFLKTACPAWVRQGVPRRGTLGSGMPGLSPIRTPVTDLDLHHPDLKHFIEDRQHTVAPSVVPLRKV